MKHLPTYEVLLPGDLPLERGLKHKDQTKFADAKEGGWHEETPPDHVQGWAGSLVSKSDSGIVAFSRRTIWSFHALCLQDVGLV